MTTIALSFDPAADDLRETLEGKPETYGPAALLETCFLTPTQLAIDGVQILALSREYLELPLLGFCVDLNDAIDKIKPGVQVDGYLAGGGELRFLEEDGKVKVWCTLNDRVAYATRSELVTAARKFRDEVRDWLVKNAPSLRSHKHWTEWFPGPSAYVQ
jgi:hypothetical protein